MESLSGTVRLTLWEPRSGMIKLALPFNDVTGLLLSCLQMQSNRLG